MILKLAFSLLSKRRSLRLFLFFQLTLTFLIAILCGTAIQADCQDYLQLRPLLRGEGLWLGAAMMSTPEGELIQDSRRLASDLPHTSWAGGYLLPDAIFTKNGLTLSLQGRALDRAITERLKPKLAEGRWLSPSLEDDTIEAVVSANDYGLHPGDHLEVRQTDFPPLELEIAGVLRNDALLWGRSVPAGADSDYRICLSPPRELGNGAAILLVDRDQMAAAADRQSRAPLTAATDGSLLLSFSPSISDQERENALAFVKLEMKRREIGSIEEFSSLRQNSVRFLLSQTLPAILILLFFLLLTLISQLTILLVTARLELRTFSVFRICGLELRRCRKILTLSGALLLSGALALALFLWTVLRLALFGSSALTEPQFIPLCLCALVFFLILLLLLIAPALILKGDVLHDLHS